MVILFTADVMHADHQYFGAHTKRASSTLFYG